MNRYNRHYSGQSLRRLIVIGLSIVMLGITQAVQAGEHYPACGAADKLQSAVANANSNGQEDYIGLAGEGCVYKLDATLYIKADGGTPLTIEGNGSIISGDDKVQPFNMEPGAVVILQNVIIQDGKGVVGGAIYSNSTLTLTNTTLYDNHARWGGALYTNGTVTINNSTIQGNTSQDEGGGIFQYGGAITVNNSFITLNEGRWGGGVWNIGDSKLTINNTLVSGNKGKDGAGGISSRGPEATLFNSLISGNTTEGYGGGLYADTGTVAVVRSTVSDNSATKNGGGVFSTGGATTYLTASTVTLNSSALGGGVQNEGKLIANNATIAYNTATASGGGLLSTAGALEIANTIISNNQGGDCSRNSSLTTHGTNLIGDGSCNFLDVLTGNAGLGTLTAPSEFAPSYYPLLPGSQAIDAGVNSHCSYYDLRGALRPMDGNGDGNAVCDLGAYEADTVDVITSTPTETEFPMTPTPTGTTETPTPPVTSTPPAEEPGIELLINGDFEQTDANQKPLLAPWKLKNANGDKVKCDNLYEYDGRCEFRFKGSASENATLTQNVKLDPFTFAAGDTLDLHAFVITDSLEVGGKIKLSVKYNDPALTADKVSVDLHQTNGYEDFGGQVTLKSGDVSKIKLQINHRSPSGKLYIDSVSLKKLQPRVDGLLPLP